jgi:hypothetical protein
MTDDRSEPGVEHLSVPPVEPTTRSIEIGREAVSQIVLLSLIAVAGALVYILYRQLEGHAPEYSGSEILIYLGLLLAILSIAISVIRIAISNYRSPAVIIPPDDRKLLEKLIESGDEKAVELYVRLSSLGGPTGTATKLGLTGLPLATIGLTIFFSGVALFVPSFLDLAKLTLGAFIGSFVQRSGEAIERAVRTGGGSTATAGGTLRPIDTSVTR